MPAKVGLVLEFIGEARAFSQSPSVYSPVLQKEEGILFSSSILLVQALVWLKGKFSVLFEFFANFLCSYLDSQKIFDMETCLSFSLLTLLEIYIYILRTMLLMSQL